MLGRLLKGFVELVGAVLLLVVAMALYGSFQPPPTTENREANAAYWADMLLDYHAQRAWGTDEVEAQRLLFEYDYSKAGEWGALSAFHYDPFLPLHGESRFEDNWNYWYSELLSRTDEPKLRRGLLLEPGTTVVRILISPHHDDAIVIRAELRSSSVRVSSKRLHSLSILNYSMHLRGAVTDEAEQQLSDGDAREFVRLVATSGLQRVKTDFDPNWKHGATWTFEASYAGRYNAFWLNAIQHQADERGFGGVLPLCRFLLARTGLREMPTHCGNPLLPPD